MFLGRISCRCPASPAAVAFEPAGERCRSQTALPGSALHIVCAERCGRFRRANWLSVSKACVAPQRFASVDPGRTRRSTGRRRWHSRICSQPASGRRLIWLARRKRLRRPLQRQRALLCHDRPNPARLPGRACPPIKSGGRHNSSTQSPAGPRPQAFSHSAPWRKDM